MNAGYLAYVLILTSVILTGFGWKLQLFGWLSRMAVLTILIGWLIFMPLTIPVMHTNIHGAVIWLFILASVFLLQLRAGAEMLLCISASFLFASIYILLHRLGDFYPAELLLSNTVYAVLCLGICTFFMFRDQARQVAVISLGTLLGECVYAVMMQRLQFGLGDVGIADFWWMTFYVARIVTVIYQAVHMLAKRLAGVLQRFKQRIR